VQLLHEPLRALPPPGRREAYLLPSLSSGQTGGMCVAPSFTPSLRCYHANTMSARATTQLSECVPVEYSCCWWSQRACCHVGARCRIHVCTPSVSPSSRQTSFPDRYLAATRRARPDGTAVPPPPRPLTRRSARRPKLQLPPKRRGLFLSLSLHRSVSPLHSTALARHVHSCRSHSCDARSALHLAVLLVLPLLRDAGGFPSSFGARR
jgi:hypothetical protein